MKEICGVQQHCLAHESVNVVRFLLFVMLLVKSSEVKCGSTDLRIVVAGFD